MESQPQNPEIFHPYIYMTLEFVCFDSLPPSQFESDLPGLNKY